MSGEVKFQTGKSRKRSLLIMKLLTTPTQRQAALETGISEATVGRLLRDPNFQAELATARAEMTAGVTSQLRAAASGAVSTLSEICGNPNAAEASRVSAAGKIIDIFIKANTIEAIDARVAAIESERAE